MNSDTRFLGGWLGFHLGFTLTMATGVLVALGSEWIWPLVIPSGLALVIGALVASRGNLLPAMTRWTNPTEFFSLMWGRYAIEEVLRAKGVSTSLGAVRHGSWLALVLFLVIGSFSTQQ